jgi:uncharacterized protein
MFLIQRLLGFLALLGLAWAVRRLFAANSGSLNAGASKAKAPPRDEGAMVRDRVCNTFLPRSRAVPLKTGDQEHFFCSERCRDAYLDRLAG